MPAAVRGIYAPSLLVTRSMRVVAGSMSYGRRCEPQFFVPSVDDRVGPHAPSWEKRLCYCQRSATSHRARGSRRSLPPRAGVGARSAAALFTAARSGIALLTTTRSGATAHAVAWAAPTMRESVRASEREREREREMVAGR
jgi:hypothetical protein